MIHRELRVVGSLVLLLVVGCAIHQNDDEYVLASSESGLEVASANQPLSVRWDNFFSQRRLKEDFLRQTLEKNARKWLGTPYEYGGESTLAMDCSAFTRRVFANVCGFFLPRRAAWQFWEGQWRARDSIRTGDLIFFRINGAEVDHVGIYLGHQQFISATSSGGVRLDNLNSSYWKNHYAGARNLLVLLQ